MPRHFVKVREPQITMYALYNMQRQNEENVTTVVRRVVPVPVARYGGVWSLYPWRGMTVR